MFSTAILDAIREKEQKEREELRLHTLKAVSDALDQLSRQVSFSDVFIFGSVVKPYGFRKGSDIDIGFTGLSVEDFFKAMSFLSGALGADVDVIHLEGHRLASKIRREGLQWTRNG